MDCHTVAIIEHNGSQIVNGVMMDCYTVRTREHNSFQLEDPFGQDEIEMFIGNADQYMMQNTSLDLVTIPANLPLLGFTVGPLEWYRWGQRGMEWLRAIVS